jgi:membrane peptidoglycan carboxypeptidase
VGRPRYDSPQGDVYGGNTYRASRAANGNGAGGHRAENRYGRHPRPPAASEGSARGNGYERSGGGRPSERFGLRGGPEGDSGRGDGYGAGNGSGRRPAGPRRDTGPDDYYGNGPGLVDYGRAGHGGRRGDRSPVSSRSFRRSSRDEFGSGGSGRGGGGRKGGKGGRPKRKGDWWRHWTWKKALGVVMGTFGGLIVAAATWIGVSYAGTSIPTDVSLTALQQASTVYFSDGKTLVGTFGTIDRQVLTYNQIPAQLRDAVLAAEDRNFYNEGGISLTGILRAAYEDTLGSGNSLQGGSTITEQFVKNYYASVSDAQTISNKLKEIFIAVKLAREKSKAWILTQYLNTIYFGDGAYGVEAAAKTYFGKPVGQLNVSEDAMIAAMLNAPGQFDPIPGSPGYKPLVARWQYVLQGMVTMHDLSPAQASAQKFPKVVTSHVQSSGWNGYNGYIMQAVYNELTYMYHYSQAEIDNGGLKIVTTFSEPMMNALYSTVRQEEKAMSARGKPLPWFAHVGAVLEQPSTGAIVAMYGGPSYSEPTAYCKKIYCNVNMALENREQVGSSFKPYVLATARAQGMSVKTSVLDGTSPLCVPSDQYPQEYSVPATGPGPSGCPRTPYGWYNLANDAGDSGVGGPQTVVYSTAQSLNTAYADLAHRVGLENVANMAKAFGVDIGAYPNGSDVWQMAANHQVGLALGQAALTVGEQANTFATLVNNGEYNTPHVIQQITKANAIVASKVTHHEVLTPAEDSDVDYALSFDTIQGTGTNAAMSDGRPIIGKTGTTNTGQSAFFLGAIPQYSLAVGMFTNQQNGSTASNAQTLNGVGGLPGYGGEWPALIWHAFAQKEFLHLPIQQFPTPDFGGTAWNLIGPGQGNPNPHPTSSQSAPPTKHHKHTCLPSPLNNDCHGGSPPPTSSPPPSTSPPPTCNPANPHCQTPPPLSPQRAADQTTGTGTAYVADRPRRLPLSGGG